MSHETKDSDPYSSSNLEPTLENALSHPHAGQFDHQAVHIHIHSVRKRPTDPDGVSGKAAIDAIVENGVLRDDNCEVVKAVTFSQEKGSDEKTVITISDE